MAIDGIFRAAVSFFFFFYFLFPIWFETLCGQGFPSRKSVDVVNKASRKRVLDDGSESNNLLGVKHNPFMPIRSDRTEFANPNPDAFAHC